MLINAGHTFILTKLNILNPYRKFPEIYSIEKFLERSKNYLQIYYTDLDIGIPFLSPNL